MSRVFRALSAASCLALLSALGLVAVSPATASTYLLCRGYDACRMAGMPHAGYKAARSTMYWQMYSGHNCTNYVAYRMVRSGMPNVRPWSGGGNATYWGTSNAPLTNTVPRVGAVAWWRANAPGAGAAGHVAYVEAVLSPDTIVVSEDNWGGDFQWRQITREGSGWPSGFVHFNDARLRNTEQPAITGAAKVGATLTASPGTWTPSPTTVRYQWLAEGQAIPGATGPNLTVDETHRDKSIAVRVVAVKLGYANARATSAATAPVEASELANTAPPEVTGLAAVGSTLTASAGGWRPAPSRLAYRWLADGAPVEGATSPRFTPTADLVGEVVSVRVTASRAGFEDAVAVSSPTQPVAPGTFTRTAAPVVTGVPRPGETLVLDPGTHTPADAEVSVRWLRGGVPVEGATGMSYRLTADDLGQPIAAQVALVKDGYTRLTSRTARTQRVKAAPTLTVQTEQPATQRLRVTIAVSAADTSPVTGTVRVKVPDRLVDLALHDGTAATTLRQLPQGLLPVRIRYAGSAEVAGEVLTRTVRIR